MQLVLNELILLVVVDRMLGERVPVVIVVVVLQKQPGLADEENLLGEWKGDVRRKHVSDQLVLAVGWCDRCVALRRLRIECSCFDLQCALPVSIGRVWPAGHGGGEPRDARRGQAHGVDVDVVVQADEELAVRVVDLAARENRCHLLDEDSMACAQEFLHRRRENGVAVQGAPTDDVENLTAAKARRLKRVNQRDERREQQRVVGQGDQQMRQGQRCIAQAFGLQLAETVKVRLKNGTEFESETEYVQTT